MKRSYMYLLSFLLMMDSLQAQSGDITLSQDLISSFRIVKWLIAGIILILGFLAYFVRERLPQMAGIPAGTEKESGRIQTSGFPKLQMILLTGLFAAGLIYFISFDPVSPQSLPVAATAMKDNELSSAEIIVSKDAALLNDGKSIFTANCAACHGANAEGTVGPNLTDNAWIHGGKITQVYQLINDGVADKGMPSWKARLKPRERLAVANYILSLQGTQPANAKSPEGTVEADAALTAGLAQTDNGRDNPQAR